MIKELIRILDNKELFSLVVFIGGFGLIGIIGLLMWVIWMADFKLNYYFTKLKDVPFSNRQNFKKYFYENYGEYQNINELIIKIER